jgi:hypothetical protein
LAHFRELIVNEETPPRKSLKNKESEEAPQVGSRLHSHVALAVDFNDFLSATR